MADLSRVPSDAIKRIKQAMDPRLQKSDPDVVKKWLRARAEEFRQRIIAKQTEIETIKNIRLVDLEVELSLLQRDLEDALFFIDELERNSFDEILTVKQITK